MAMNAGRILLLPKGDYNSSTQYEMMDWVRYNRAAWVCKKNCINQEPQEISEYWQLIVKDSELVGMVGATSTIDGSSGAVPKPIAGDNEKYLCGDGTYKKIDASDKADGKGIAFSVINGIPYMDYDDSPEEYVPDTQEIDNAIDNIYDGDETNDAPPSQDITDAIENIYDGDETNDAPSDDEIDAVLNQIFGN